MIWFAGPLLFHSPLESKNIRSDMFVLETQSYQYSTQEVQMKIAQSTEGPAKEC